MPIPDSYLITVKNVELFFNSLLSAQAPEKFSNKFLQDLEFKSTNDRLYIRVLKTLGFLDDSGSPTQLYFDFLDQSQSKSVLATAIKDSYSDLFAVNTSAQNLSVDEVRNKLKTLTQGKKSDKIVGLMANTFVALCQNADFSKTQPKEVAKNQPTSTESKRSPTLPNPESKSDKPMNSPGLHYNFQIHLPDTRDSSVYDAIFKSLRDHIL